MPAVRGLPTSVKKADGFRELPVFIRYSYKTNPHNPATISNAPWPHPEIRVVNEIATYPGRHRGMRYQTVNGHRNSQEFTAPAVGGWSEDP
jgi:hypothetical protein